MFVTNFDSHTFRKIKYGAGIAVNFCIKCGMEAPNQSEDWVPNCWEAQRSFGDFDEEAGY